MSESPDTPDVGVTFTAAEMQAMTDAYARSLHALAMLINGAFRIDCTATAQDLRPIAKSIVDLGATFFPANSEIQKTVAAMRTMVTDQSVPRTSKEVKDAAG